MYSIGRTKGVVLILDCKDVAEARSVMEALPLAKAQLVNLEFSPHASDATQAPS
jgi:hypothetical protein